MNTRNALLQNNEFDADFNDEFGDDFRNFDTATETLDDMPEFRTDGDPAPASQDISQSLSQSAAHTGQMSIPRISIHAFCEKASTAKVIEAAARDRRLAKAVVTVDDGGLVRAIQHYREEATPDLLIVESSAAARDMLNQIDELAGHCDPNIRVLVIGSMNDVQLYRQLVARGVSEYLVPPFKPLNLIDSITTLYVDPDKPFIGRSVAVVGAKGGVGASTIAHNLAWSVSENIQINTTLVDLDLSWGTTSLDFNQESNQSVADALGDPDRVDDAVLDRLVSKVSSRLAIFTAPANLNTDYDIDDDAYEVVIDQVRKTVPFVVLDLPHNWTSWTKQTAINADEIVIVCSPDLPSLRNGKNLVDFLKAARSNDSPPRLVINMSGIPKRPEIPIKDFADAIGLEPDLVLPFDPQIFGAASNNGQMLSESAPTSKAAQGVDYLASLLTGREVSVPPTGILDRLMGKKKR